MKTTCWRHVKPGDTFYVLDEGFGPEYIYLVDSRAPSCDCCIPVIMVSVPVGDTFNLAGTTQIIGKYHKLVKVDHV